MRVDPLTRLSPHFILADFLGNHSVYSQGLRNDLEGSAEEVEFKLENGRALCNEMLEPLLAEFGPLTVSYGFISPAVSRKLVTYQNPDQPSHHRWDLGAAADVCVHNWVEGSDWPIADPALELEGSPIMLAMHINQKGLPYSRLITYSESPFICVSVSAAELAQDRPRLMMYENRYSGRPKAKPEWLTYGSENTRRRAHRMLMEQGLPAPWAGSGYPTYHGGGRVQYQHQRVSKYTMLSDWLFDLQSIAKGSKNIPALNLDSVQDAIGAAGLIYDQLIDEMQAKRFSIIAGYVSASNPGFNPNNDWRSGTIAFKLLPPEADDLVWMMQVVSRMGGRTELDDDGGLWIAAEVEDIYGYVTAAQTA